MLLRKVCRLVYINDTIVIFKQDVFVDWLCVFTVVSGCSSWGGVLRCRFCYYSRMVRLTDQEMIAIEKIVCYWQFPKGGDMLCYSGPCGEAPGLVRMQREQGGIPDTSLVVLVGWKG